MKKRRLWLVVLSLIISICACFCIAACNGNSGVGNNEGGNSGGNYEGGGNNGGNETVATALTAPSVTIDVNGKATWNDVEGASGYAFKIDGGDMQIAENREVLLENGQSVAVKAKGDGVSYTDSDFSAPKTYKAPAENFAAPENLKVEIQGTDAGNVILSWNAVEGANGYKYAVNGAEQNVTVEENSVTVDLLKIDAAKLDLTWVFKVKTLGNEAEGTADDGDYSGFKGSSGYCKEVEFAVSNDEIYTAAEILKIMNYYGEALPYREFTVTGTIASNADGKAVLENGFTLFASNVPELYLAIDDRLTGFTVTTFGTLKTEGTVKGLSCSNRTYYPIDFENIGEEDRYALVIETLNAWDMLKEDSKIVSDFYLPLKLYGVNIEWAVDEEEAFAIDGLGNVTVTCPEEGEEDILVILEAMLYIDDGHACDEVLEYMFAITHINLIQLAAPKININPKTGVATWNEIEHATGYYVEYYGYSVPGDYYSEYVYEYIIIPADGERNVQLKDEWWISVYAIGDGKTYKDSEVDPKQYNYYPETVEPDGTPLEFDLTKLTQTGDLADANYIFGLACGNASVFESAYVSRVVLGNNDANGAVTGTGFIKVGSSSNDGKITLNFNKKITGVVITARQWNKNGTDKVSVNGSQEQTASKDDWGIMYFNFTAANASATVEIDTNNRVFIQSITVYVAD